MAENRIELDTGTDELLCEILDRVALITLNRPEARNALSDRLTPALRRIDQAMRRRSRGRRIADYWRR